MIKHLVKGETKMKLKELLNPVSPASLFWYPKTGKCVMFGNIFHGCDSFEVTNKRGIMIGGVPIRRHEVILPDNSKVYLFLWMNEAVLYEEKDDIWKVLN